MFFSSLKLNLVLHINIFISITATTDANVEKVFATAIHCTTFFLSGSDIESMIVRTF